MTEYANFPSEVAYLRHRVTIMSDCLRQIRGSVDSLLYAAPEMQPLFLSRIESAIKDGLGDDV